MVIQAVNHYDKTINLFSIPGVTGRELSEVLGSFKYWVSNTDTIHIRGMVASEESAIDYITTDYYLYNGEIMEVAV